MEGSKTKQNIISKIIKSIKNKLTLIITALVLIGLISSTSYAVLKGEITSDKSQVIRAGSVKLMLTENYENINGKIITMTDEKGLIQEQTYEFNIKNIGNGSAKYDIKLINEVPSDYAGEVLSDEYLRIGLEINGEEYGPFSLDEVENIIDSNEIYEKEIINYTLRIWLDESKKEELLNLDNYTTFLTLKIEAEQRDEEMDTGETTIFNYTGDAQEYIVPRDGYYYIELAGAQGGTVKENYPGATGSIASGYIELEANDKLYFYVGGAGVATETSSSAEGGYNGGGRTPGYSNHKTTSGGGATDVRLIKQGENEKYRYVRNYLNGSSINTSNHWVEIEVYDILGNLISSGKDVTYSGTATTNTSYNNPDVITDGDKTTTNYFDISTGENVYVEIDLGAEYEIGSVKIWHYFKDERIYEENKIELLNKDKTYNVIMFDSDITGTYAETSSGKSFNNVQYRESLISRIMVAAGGAGGSGSSTSYELIQGNAGGLYGVQGQSTNSTYSDGTYSAGGGNQMRGGIGYLGRDGVFGAAYNGFLTGYGSGGGGGYYGGASGFGRSGGGGSSYISGYAGVNSIENSPTITHTNETLHYSNKYFIGSKLTSEIDEGNKGNGYAKIIYVNDKPKRKNTELNNVRYIKNCESYNTSNNGNHWNEIQAIKDGVNIAKGKTVTADVEANSNGPYTLITDGDITYSNWARPVSYSTNQCVTLDLEAEYDLDEIAVWNYFGDPRSYYGNTTYVSKDNSTWTTVINEAVIESSNGHRVNAYTDIYNGYVQDGLVLWYDGYANTGTVKSATSTTWKNLASSSYSGTLNGGTWYNNNLYFDGTDDWVSIAELNLDTITMEVVYKIPESNSADMHLISNVNSGGYDIAYSNAKQSVWTEYYIDSGYRQLLSEKYTLNTMTTTTSSYDQKTINLYTKGKLYDSLDYPGAIGLPTNSTYIVLGANPTGTSVSGTYLKGNIYSVRIYDRALSEKEVKNNYMYDKEKFNLE